MKRVARCMKLSVLGWFSMLIIGAFVRVAGAKLVSSVAAYWQTVIGKIPVKLDSVLNPKWLNASVKLEQVKTEIDAFIKKINVDIETVKMMNSPFETELMHTLFSTLDISAVLRHKQALESLSKQKEVEAEQEHAEVTESVPAPPCEAEGL